MQENFAAVYTDYQWSLCNMEDKQLIVDLFITTCGLNGMYSSASATSPITPAGTFNWNHSGATSIPNYLGFSELNKYWWIDGIAGIDGRWYMCENPMLNASDVTTSTAGYTALSNTDSGSEMYVRPTSDGCISKLGYDPNHPFVNMPIAVVSNSNYNTYYCDGYYYSSGSHPVYSSFGSTSAYDGPWYCSSSLAWSYSSSDGGVRLCAKPFPNLGN